MLLGLLEEGNVARDVCGIEDGSYYVSSPQTIIILNRHPNLLRTLSWPQPRYPSPSRNQPTSSYNTRIPTPHPSSPRASYPLRERMPRFQVNQLMKGLIMSVDPINQNVEPTFRSGTLSGSARPALSLSDLQEGENIKGRIKMSNFMALPIEIESPDYAIRPSCPTTKMQTPAGQAQFPRRGYRESHCLFG
ncbi:hypothetical protein BJY52DRAFT_174320 [Lactarius psammicola]|nr:hypothetical protein BJY52DRAFT_174320 [Lactarius psammicola]